MKKIISSRRLIQFIAGAAILGAVFYFDIGLQYVLIAGVVTGVVFGKVFCRWMCPMGLMMELMLGGNNDATQKQLYNYHKLGCPIAWITGLLNRFSVFKIKRDAKTCIDCGICDKKCYISSLNKEYSLFRKNMKDPATHFSCSKCLACVEHCPAGSLEYKI